MKTAIRICLATAATAVIGLGCGTAPQYTVIDPNAPATSSSSGGLSEWPNVGEVTNGTGTGKDVAVIVAIEDYAFLPDVKGAIRNANDWETYFRKGRGFKDVFVLTDKQAPLEEIKRFAEDTAKNAPEGGSVWFVFIGHGAAVKDGSDGALIGMDAQQTIESIQARSMARSELVATLEKGKQAQTVVVLDTCFSGRDGGGNLLAEGTQPVVPVSAVPATATSTVVLSAAQNDQVAGQLPNSERPAFSYLLLGALRGWADNGDGTVTADEAVAWTTQQLRHVKGRQQTPGVDGAKTATLASGATEADPGIADLMAGKIAAPATEPTAAASNGDEQMIDTNEGLVFVKPADWGIGSAGMMGVVLSLRNQFSGNEIMVVKHETAQQNAAGYLQPPMDANVVTAPTPKEYTHVKGRISAYKETDPNFGDTEVHMFDTYMNGAVWRFVLNLRNLETKDADLAAFEEFLGKVTFK